MSRRTSRLTVDDLGMLPGPCRSCLFWQLDPVRRARVPAGEAAAEKEAWLSEVLREWGSCGQVVRVDGRPVGYTIYAPAAWVPGARVLPTTPISPDALLLATVYVDPEHAGGGLGRMLVQAMARDLIRRGGIRAVEAIGVRHAPAGNQCVVPAGFLAGVGFKTQRAHPTHPRMRMDLSSALTWRDEVEQAVERLVGLVGTVRPVRPAPKSPPARG